MRRIVLVAALSVLLACADDGPDYGGLEFDVISAPPVPIQISDLGIDLTEGIAAKVAVEPRSTGEPYGERTPVALKTRNAEVLAVYATEEERSFVLVAVHPGDTCIEVLIGREPEECIPVRVRAGETALKLERP